MMTFARVVSYTVAIASILTGSSDGFMDQQYCTRSKSASADAILSTAYAPSLIVCSFICKENRNCKTFKFSDGVCTMYWKSADQPAPGNPDSPVTCYNNRIGCPTSIGGGKYICTYSTTQQFCLCTSTAAMQWQDGDTSCKSFTMKLIAVQNAVKNTFIKSFLGTQTTTFNLAAKSNKLAKFPCAWTSGVRDLSGGNRSFIWSTTQTKVDLTMNDSYYNDNSGDYLMYSGITPEGKWRWDDDPKTVWCNILCEFAP